MAKFTHILLFHLTLLLSFVLISPTTLLAQGGEPDKKAAKKDSSQIIKLSDNSSSSNSKFDYGETDILISDPLFDLDTIPETRELDIGGSELLEFEEKKTSTEPAPKAVKIIAPPPSHKSGKVYPEYESKEVKDESNYQSSIIKDNKLIEKIDKRSYNFAPDEVPEYTDEEYRTRLERLPTMIPMEYNRQVKAFIDMYVIHKRNQVKRMLAKTDIYFPTFEAALDRHDMPMELKFLPVIESALIPHARSKDGAVGLWQLTYGTGKMYGLEANSYIDERRDPVLATEAAVKHIKNLYKKYRDWYLVIAAYNCGEGTLNKAIKRAGGEKNYWLLSKYLPKETRSYVPLYIAATYVMNYYPEHNLFRHNPPYSFYSTDTVIVKSATDLKQVARFINMELQELQFLNPAIKRNIIPFSKKGYPIVLPTSKIGLFEVYMRNRKSVQLEIILERNPSKDLAQLPIDNPWNYEMDDYGTIRPKETVAPLIKGKVNVTYTIQQGDVLATVAELFDCSVENLMRWNDLKKLTSLEAGKTLKVWVPAEHEMVYRNIEMRNLKDDSEKKSSNGSTSKDAKKTEKATHVSYTVQDGDSLWIIASKFSGVSAEDIKFYNNLESNFLKSGMVIYIPIPAN